MMKSTGYSFHVALTTDSNNDCRTFTGHWSRVRPPENIVLICATDSAVLDILDILDIDR